MNQTTSWLRSGSDGASSAYGLSILHECVDEQRHDRGKQDDHPIRNLEARYRCFLAKPFHDFPPRMYGAQLSFAPSGTPTLIQINANAIARRFPPP